MRTDFLRVPLVALTALATVAETPLTAGAQQDFGLLAVPDLDLTANDGRTPGSDMLRPRPLESAGAALEEGALADASAVPGSLAMLLLRLR